MDYRREIDGLRAVAVASVVLYHGGFQLFSGGFVGVDVFFVISGYLITFLIIEERSLNKFNLIGFYERRARRILPALFTVMAFCMPLVWFLLTPPEIENFAVSAVSVVLFISNFYFSNNSGYFDIAAELNPLLHTWSLAVEEQYYILFPYLIILIWKFGKRFILLIFVFIFALSVFVMFVWVESRPVATFFLLPSRIWEFLVGAFLAFHLSYNQRWTPGSLTSEIGGAVGFLLILLSIFLIDSELAYPGVSTFAPTVGAALVILFGTPNTVVGWLLGLKGFVRIGLISYSAYLWHQPLISFALIKNLGQKGGLLYVFLVALSFVLAYFTWKYVETPFRNKNVYTGKSIIILWMLGSFVFLFVGVVAHETSGFYRWRATADQQKLIDTAKSSPMRDSCHTGGVEFLKPPKSCEYFVGKIDVAVIGDSHAVELAYGLAEELKLHNKGLKHFSFSNCIPTFGFLYTNKYKSCSDWTNEVVEYVANDHAIKTVVVTYRINAALNGGHEGVYPGLPSLVDENERFARWSSYARLLNYLSNRGKRVVLVLQAPELPLPITTLIYSGDVGSNGVVGVSRKWWSKRSDFVYQNLDGLNSNVTIFDPATEFCDRFTCYAARDGVSYYFDDDHLSVDGARLIAKKIVNFIEK